MPVTPAKYSILGLALSVLAILASVLVGTDHTHAKKVENGLGSAAKTEMIDAGFVPVNGHRTQVVAPGKVNC